MAIAASGVDHQAHLCFTLLGDEEYPNILLRQVGIDKVEEPRRDQPLYHRQVLPPAPPQGRIRMRTNAREILIALFPLCVRSEHSLEATTEVEISFAHQRGDRRSVMDGLRHTNELG